MADDPLAAVERWLIQAAAQLDPSARRALMRAIGRELRRRTRARIARETGPDGAPWPARKRGHDGRVRKKARMLQGMRDLRRLGLAVTADGMDLGYAGPTARIAGVHQRGEVDAVAPGGPRVKYPARPLLGIEDDDLAFVRATLLAAISPP